MRTCWLILISVGLSACGFKGDLYLPDDAPKTAEPLALPVTPITTPINSPNTDAVKRIISEKSEGQS